MFFFFIELLRKTAESILVDMVQLLFARLPLFKEEIKFSVVKKVKKNSYTINIISISK